MADQFRYKLMTDLTAKDAPSDTDLVAVGNNGSSALRKLTFASIANAIKTKLLTWTFTNLTTSSKTLPGAVNELNSNSVSCRTTTETDFNNFPNNSWVWANNTSNTYTNAPSTSAFHVMTIQNGGYYKAQIAIGYANSGVYIRTNTGSSWTVWKAFSFV